ncbi:hypothetical protein IW261DRAFT_1612298 [Armillaria novae-zelandiae]|uniref:AAA-ATPase-like domain-containing protein n=1 Tax=Armillaria novae-zelandiae TaxID=153914 RepID=A0AA39NSJ8_9AGAR|nr:hypothetical protein IW261DRAFT_1612298 [Armillaria novae-zelandiae]
MSASPGHAFSLAASSVVDSDSPTRSKHFGNPRVALKALSAYDLLYSSGVIWADKTACIIDLTVKSRLLRRLSLVRRPEGFGKTSFLAILEFFYDCKHFTTPISDTVLKSTHVFDVDPNAPLMVLPHCDLVLTLDLSVPLTKDFPQERFLVGPLSSFLRDLRPGLIMGTGDESDPRMSPYHSRPSVWESIATDPTDHEMLEVAFGFMPDEVREFIKSRV